MSTLNILLYQKIKPSINKKNLMKKLDKKNHKNMFYLYYIYFSEPTQILKYADQIFLDSNEPSKHIRKITLEIR